MGSFRVLIAFLWCFNSHQFAAHQPAQFVISSNEIAFFNYGIKQLRIWSSAANNRSNTSPVQYQFRYDPLFTPVLDVHRNILFRKTKLTDHNYRAYIFIDLDDEKAQAKAFESVIKAYPPDVSHMFQKSNVFALPVKWVKIDFQELTDIVPQLKLVSSFKCDQWSSNSSACYIFDGSMRRFKIMFKCPNQNCIDELERALNYTTLVYDMQVQALRETRSNHMRVSFGQLKLSKFYLNLTSDGKKEYIRRNDLRNMLKSFRQDVETHVLGTMIEDSRTFDDIFLQSLLDRWSKVSSESFNETNWTSTFNGDLLRHDSLNRELSRMLVYDESSGRFKFNLKFKQEYLDNETFSEEDQIGVEDLKRVLKSKDMSVRIEASRVLVSSIELIRINWSDFDEEKSFTLALSYLAQPVEMPMVKSFIDFSNYGPSSFTPHRTARGENADYLPIGSIISFHGSEVQVSQTKRMGFWVCDGRRIDDPLSPLYNASTPDLRNLFLLGSTESGRMGGDEKQRVTFNKRFLQSSNRNWQSYDHETDRTSQTREIDIIPRFFSVVYLIKATNHHSDFD